MYAKSPGGRNQDSGRVTPFLRARRTQAVPFACSPPSRSAEIADTTVVARPAPRGPRAWGSVAKRAAAVDPCASPRPFRSIFTLEGKRCREQAPRSKCCPCARASPARGLRPDRGMGYRPLSTFPLRASGGGLARQPIPSHRRSISLTSCRKRSSPSRRLCADRH
jgi:hypothetical protein